MLRSRTAAARVYSTRAVTRSVWSDDTQFTPTERARARACRFLAKAASYTETTLAGVQAHIDRGDTELAAKRAREKAQLDRVQARYH